MKNLFLLPFFAFSLTVASVAEAQAQIPEIVKNHKDRALFTEIGDGTAGTIALFNGENLDGWYTFTPKYGKNNDVENEFTVVDGALRFAGQPMGYICTNESYKNYYLRVVFRWGEKKYPPLENAKRDSGILYHFPGDVEDTLWPTSIECQVQEGDCGDYFCVGGATADSPNGGYMRGTQKYIAKTENFENPNPEWNTIEVICYDDRSEHYVNGHLVNEAYNLSTTEGKILFQLEGSDVFYKTIELMPLK